MEVTFFPRNDYPNNVEVCAHRYGKTMTYTEDSDFIRNSVDWIMPLAISNGVKFSLFTCDTDVAVINRSNDLLDYYKQNKLWLDIYFYTPQAESGTITEEIYNEYKLKYFDLFSRMFGIRPPAFAYSYGNTTFSEYAKNDFLGARASDITGDTDYGIGYGTPNNFPYSKNRYITKSNSARWYDDVANNPEIPNPTITDFRNRLETLSTQIDAALANGGWFNNFAHIANVYAGGSVHQQAYEEYFALLSQKNANDEIYFAGYGEAVAYLVYRQMTQRCVMYSPHDNPQNELIIRMETNNTSLSVNTDLLTVPISVKFSTIGTPLENRTIKSNLNLISLGNNQYIVEIPWSRFPVAIINAV